MMQFSELASRYANALHELCRESGTQDKVLKDLRSLEVLLEKNPEIFEFLNSPLVRPSNKAESLEKACAGNGLDENTKSFLLTLANKGRFSIFNQIVKAFEAKNDEVNGVTRGDVVSSSVLSPEERKEIEQKVEAVVNKKVILTYHEDPNHIGGLVASVGSYTFDDTLTNHLQRLQDDLNRRAH